MSERHRPEIADAFLARVEEAESLLSENNYAGTEEPYLLAGQYVVLKELYFDSGPVTYCLIHEVFDEYIGLIGSRKTGTLKRLWRV
ncbi:MAG: hypothetical protein P4L44_02780 [Oryzomonas sp.]|uniref:hypothetical protein n=1 Tax=Oryzomonas sp. TaxID=2855186 RepID=UPI002847F338|nr:hypothetical protein [Oryzomonas sp.]MDR3578870.1 hypothetical protein [Oryzomonas sp.]